MPRLLLRFATVLLWVSWVPPMSWMPPQQRHHIRRPPSFLGGNMAANPSDKQDVKGLLGQRSITFKPKSITEEDNATLTSFNEVRNSLRNEFPNGGHLLPSASEALENLTMVMNATYVNENHFDRTLFAAIGNLLKAYVLEQKDPNSIVLKVGNTQDYGVGIARQKSPAGNLVDASKSIQDSSTSTGMNADATTDHVVGILRNKNNNKWTMTDCMAVVELKTNVSSCDIFDVSALTGQMLQPDLSTTRHAALGQVILYNLGLVLLHRAKLGISISQIPLAIIAGKTTMKQQRDGLAQQCAKKGALQKATPKSKKQGKRKARKSTTMESTESRGKEEHVTEQKPQQVTQKQQNRKLHWVSGVLEVPQACGGKFRYSVQGYGPFSYDNDDDTVERAATLYVNTISYGLVAAIKVQKMLAAGEVPLAVAASGQSLMMGDVKLDLQFCASPIPSAVAIQDPTTNLKISQGDLFRGKLDVSDVLSNTKGIVLDFRSAEKVGASDVLVKVSSTTVHNHLIGPTNARIALLRVAYEGDERLVKEIGSVLQAAVPMGPNLMTIMNDMTKMSYKALEPTDHSDQLDILWDGFRDLVVRALLPMAQLKIIHAGIRPGMDETSSILCKLCTEKGKVTKVTMKLINFESLVESDNWNTAFADDSYLKIEEGWDATTYVWWQCMAVAYTWKESLAQGLGLELMKSCLLFDLDGPAWMDKYRDRAKGRITSVVVEKTLVDLAKEFCFKPQQLLFARK